MDTWHEWESLCEHMCVFACRVNCLVSTHPYNVLQQTSPKRNPPTYSKKTYKPSQTYLWMSTCKTSNIMLSKVKHWFCSCHISYHKTEFILIRMDKGETLHILGIKAILQMEWKQGSLNRIPSLQCKKNDVSNPAVSHDIPLFPLLSLSDKAGLSKNP